MLDQLHEAYAQMQPGDKMVMHLHKSPMPPRTQYEMPGAPGASSMPDATAAPPAGPMTLAPNVGAPSPSPLADPSNPAPYLTPDTGSIPQAASDPMASRQALMQQMAARFGVQV